MIRKTGFILIVVVPVVAVVTLYLLRNPLVAGLAERAIGGMLGTEVSVEGVDLNPFAMTASFGKLRIVNADDPARYLLVAGPGQFGVNGLQLFAGRVIIDRLEVLNVGLGIGRPAGEVSAPKPAAAPTPESAGSPGPAAGGAAAPQAEEQGDSGMNIELPTVDWSALGGKVDVDALMGKGSLGSMQALDRAEQDGNERIAKLNAAYAGGNFEQRYQQLQAEFQALDFNSKNPQVLQKSLNALQPLSKRAQELNRDVNQFSKAANNDYAAIRGSYGDIDRQVNADIKSVSSLANLGNLDASNLGEMLFGRAVLDKFDFVMAQFDRAKAMLRSDDKQVQTKPQRRAGRIITYRVTGRAYPRFLIELLAFSGFTQDSRNQESMRYTGKLVGLSSNARVYGSPMLLEATATRAGAESWRINGSFDHRGEVGQDTLTALGENVDLGEINMGGGDLLPEKALARNGSVSVKFGLTGDQLDGSMIVKANRMTFVFADGKPKDELASSIRDAFTGIDDADVTATLRGKFSSPGFSVDSSLDDVISKRLQQMLSKRMAQTEREIRAQIEAQVGARRKALEASLGSQSQGLQSSLGQLQQQTDAFNKMTEQEKKAAEKAVKDALQKAGGDKLKGLLR
ncbi:MAG: TIGR03545 family protein [Candidatus Lambdaproteobacteria bacterium]|nr:TIGR03545 family protein [Candidatus Lambdaproteobacteria bacterium]